MKTLQYERGGFTNIHAGAFFGAPRRSPILYRIPQM